VPDNKLDALIAELQAIEIFDRAGEESGLKDQISRAGFEARGMRRLEIIREIDVLMKKRDEGDKAGGQDEGKAGCFSSTNY